MFTIPSRENIYATINREKLRVISFSQISKFYHCPHQWKLQYVDKIKDEAASIHLIFGSAVHRLIQEYLYTAYNSSVKEANAIDYQEKLKTCMSDEFVSTVKKVKRKDFTNPHEMSDFYQDGIQIFEDFAKNRTKYFSTKETDFIGYEVPLLYRLESNPKVAIIAYLDLVFYDKIMDKILIYDLKTSTRAWTDNQKKNEMTRMQLILYKILFSKIYDVPINKIEVEFLILKRQIYESSEFPQRRIQSVKPPSGSITIKKTEKLVENFVSNVFDLDGNIKPDFVFEHALSVDDCKWCGFKNTELCQRKRKSKKQKSESQEQ